MHFVFEYKSRHLSGQLEKMKIRVIYQEFNSFSLMYSLKKSNLFIDK